MILEAPPVRPAGLIALERRAHASAGSPPCGRYLPLPAPFARLWPLAVHLPTSRLPSHNSAVPYRDVANSSSTFNVAALSSAHSIGS